MFRNADEQNCWPLRGMGGSRPGSAQRHDRSRWRIGRRCSPRRGGPGAPPPSILPKNSSTCRFVLVVGLKAFFPPNFMSLNRTRSLNVAPLDSHDLPSTSRSTEHFKRLSSNSRRLERGASLGNSPGAAVIVPLPPAPLPFATIGTLSPIGSAAAAAEEAAEARTEGGGGSA